MKKAGRVLVDGTVTRIIPFKGLVAPEIACDDWFDNKAFEIIGAKDGADSEVKIHDRKFVKITNESANKYTDKVINFYACKDIIIENNLKQ